MSESEGKRLFLGVRVSVATANAISACAESLQRRAREAKPGGPAGIELKWVAPANYHITLKFLGWTRNEAIGAVRDAVAEAVAGLAPSKHKVSRLGAFRSLDHADVLWAGVDDGTGALAELAARCERACVALGFAAEPRAFHPHVTIARLRETRPVRELVLPLSEQMFSDTRVDAVVLFESETKSGGSVYREVAKIALEKAENRPETADRRQTGAVELGDETDDGWPRGHGGFAD